MTETPLPSMPDLCWPVDTSCVPDWDAWDIEPDPEADPPVVGVPLYSEADKEYAIALAGQSMRLLTGFRVGGCPVTVRPSGRGCVPRTWRAYPVAGLGSVPWSPISVDGQWMNIGCGHAGGCGCVEVHQVRLAGSPSQGAVTEVKVDGLVLDPSAYRLDPGGLLVRLDGLGWPLCQDLTKADTEEGTWSVSYTPGVAVDGLGARAAGILAGQFVRACTGGSCDLPNSVTQIVRQGVTLTLGVGAFPGGRTGIRSVDSYLERWNPQGHTTPPTVYSPDLRRHRRTY